MVTWLYYTVREFVEFDQIRGLPAAAAEEFCRRRVLTKLPFQLESKKDMKGRIKRSPDTGDACAIIAGLARQRLGMMPGSSEFMPAGVAVAGGMTPESFTNSLNSLDAEGSMRYSTHSAMDSVI
jgi:hypothetical protein